MRRDYYKTNKEDGYILYSWRFSINGLVHGNINAKTVLLLPHGIQVVASWTTGIKVLYDSMIGYTVC